MFLVDRLLRQGHLSDDAITRALVAGRGPRHLDSCDLCARRALELGRWMESVRVTAVDAADEAFPAERLAAQKAQILRKLEQLDAPARVLSFPTAPVQPPREVGSRRVAPAWLGVAAAAGVVVGVIGGQIGAPKSGPAPASSRTSSVETATVQPAIALDVATGPSSILELNLESFTPDYLQGLDDMTPKLREGRYTVVQR